jgi:hypothetical protein
MIRIWVATAYSGENDFEESKKMILSQTSVKIDHFVVRNKPILEAFNEIYQTWNSVQSKYDAFLQIDADMVMRTDVVAKTIYDRMRSVIGCNHIHLPVYDHMTMQNIWGVHMYGPTLRWKPVTDKNRPDGPKFHDSPRILQLGERHEKALIDHCPNPDCKTAFHYGWHRRLRGKNIRNHLARALQIDPKRWRKFALEGFDMAEKYMKTTIVDENTMPIEYTSPVFIENYERCEKYHE